VTVDGIPVPAQVALITGGDSGIGRAVAVAFAREGARVAICYHTHDGDAQETLEMVFGEQGAKAGAIAIKGDLKDEAFASQAV
jgi:NAD(P)-dependent dehydrogenase (short-subunit alcohol dehydrogenase family)